MTNCCNDYGQCEHGPGCPAGAATLPPEPKPAARSCEALGVCQHPERECKGVCEQTPRMSFWFETGAQLDELDDAVLLWRDGLVTAVLIAATVGVSVGVVYGAVRFLMQGWAS